MEETRITEEILAKYIAVLPKSQHISSNDVGIGISDKEKHLFYKPGKTLDLKIVPGTPLKPGTAIVRAMEQKRRTTTRGDKALLARTTRGFAFKMLR